ncbi:hypothetical protein P7L66_13185 [Tistrella mobilis]|uniref:hypothetical protein n=1 Tax=Tistrella mobilis TaxID=171437 RepID=UPI003557597E
MTWTPKPDTLPGILSIVARIAGVDAALRLAEAHGGTRLYVPRDVRPGHELARVLGVQAARLVCYSELGGDTHPVPSAAPLIRATRARRLRAEGWTHARIARELGITETHAARLTAGVARGNGGPDDVEVAPVCPTCGRAHRRRLRRQDGRQMDLDLGRCDDHSPGR